MAEVDGIDRYACKHCRRVLFTTADLMDHTPERHQISARRLLKDAKTMQTQTKNGVLYVDGCASFFLEEQLPWMDEESLAEGKLKCPNDKCQSRVGSFDWAGSQCSCGTWVTPSIKITKSRVDLIIKVNAMPIVSTIMAVPTYAQQEGRVAQADSAPVEAPAAQSTETRAKCAATVNDFSLDE